MKKASWVTTAVLLWLMVCLAGCDALVDQESLQADAGLVADLAAEDTPAVDLLDSVADTLGDDQQPPDLDGIEDSAVEESSGDDVETEDFSETDLFEKDQQGPCQPPEFQEEGQKIVSLAFGQGGFAGESLDVDGDPETCSPPGQCQEGYNNQLSGMVNQLQQFVDTGAELNQALEDGELVLLLEPVDPNFDGLPFKLNFLLGEAVADKETCDWQLETCQYTVLQDSLDPVTCNVRFQFHNATVVDGLLKAGGPDAKIAMVLPLSDSFRLEVEVHMAHVQGVVSGVDSIDGIENGILAGAVRKAALLDAIDSLPAEVVEALPVSPEMVTNLLDAFIVPDVDTNNDGQLDGASLGMKFTTIAATITATTQ